MKHAYRDARGRFAPLPPPPPPPPRPTPPRWVDGRFVSKQRGRELAAQETEFTGKAARTVMIYPTARAAAQVVQAIEEGGDFLARAYTRIAARPALRPDGTSSGWVVSVDYHYAKKGQVSP